MQTISVPYTTDEDSRAAITRLRRIQSAAVRTAYANAVGPDGKRLKQKDLRDLVKAHFAGHEADAWLLHTATLEGIACRERVPDGSMVFGGKCLARRRAKGLIPAQRWKNARLRPLNSAGDKTRLGNRHFRLAEDAETCALTVYGARYTLVLADMRGKHHAILQQIARDAALGLINVQFSLGDHRLNITIDETKLTAHPDRRSPQTFAKNRVLAVDMNPNWVGVSVVDMGDDGGVTVKDWRLFDLTGLNTGTRQDRSQKAAADQANKITTEVAEIAESIANLARSWNAGLIGLENLRGMPRGDLGRGANHNRLVLNLWTRQHLTACLKRHARQRGVEVLEVNAAYSSTIGNLLHEFPDAVAASIEIGRRTLEVRRGRQDRFYPVYSGDALAQRWKHVPGVVEAGDWVGLHGALKRANVRVRRPHPVAPSAAFEVRAHMSRTSRVSQWRVACANSPA